MDLTPHEEKILELIRKYPKVVTDPDIRRQVAEKNSLSEKTLRNRIADFKKYGLLGSDRSVVAGKNKQQIIDKNDEIKRHRLSEEEYLELLYEKSKKANKLSEYKILKVIGRGGFGKVFLCTHMSDKCKPLAIKAIRKDKIIDKKTVELI